MHPGKHVLDEVDQLEFIKEFVDPILEDEERPHWRELLIEHFAKCHEKEKNPYVDILAAVQVWHMARLGIASELRRKMPVTMSEFAKAGLIAAVETYRHLVAHQLPGRSGRGDEDCDWYLDGYLKASHKRRVAISANAFDVLCARDFFKIRGFLFG